MQKDLSPHDDTYSSKWPNLADHRLGTKVLYATDDFFAEKENLIKPGRGVFITDKYTENGKWMDGWESRRKRVPGNDHCIVRLGLRGVIKAVDIDTNHFTGNHPPFGAIEVCDSATDPDGTTKWIEALPKSPLKSSSQNLYPVAYDRPVTHVRLQIYPDGGVARLRVYGEVQVDWSRYDRNAIIDLLAIENGGKAITCNDMFYSHIENLIYPGRGKNMGDGWETKRKREPGHDWAILALGARGVISRLVVDTCHFKGNYPDRCSVEGADVAAGSDPTKATWRQMLPEMKLSADHIHAFEKEVADLGPITHVRLNMYPDGGISRFRCFGKLV